MGKLSRVAKASVKAQERAKKRQERAKKIANQKKEPPRDIRKGYTGAAKNIGVPAAGAGAAYLAVEKISDEAQAAIDKKKRGK